MTAPMDRAREMRRAGHTASAIARHTGITQSEAQALSREIDLGWTEGGFFTAGTDRVVREAPVEIAPVVQIARPPIEHALIAVRRAAESGTDRRGFASMDPDLQREIASRGGLSVPAEKRSFSRSPELAAAAGRKGGKNVPAERRSFATDRELAATAGRTGGSKSHAPWRAPRKSDLNFKRSPPPVTESTRERRAAEQTEIAAAIAAGKLTKHAPGSGEQEPLPLRAAHALIARGYAVESDWHSFFRVNGKRYSTSGFLMLASQIVPEIVPAEACFMERASP